MSSLLIIGAGGHARSVLDLALSLGTYDGIVFATNREGDDPVPGYDLLDERSLSPVDMLARFCAAVVAIGDNRARLAKVRLLSSLGMALPALVHQRAHVSPLARLGRGTVVMAGAVVGAFAEVGAGCIVNTGAVVEHECRLGDGVHVSPGAVVAGGCSVGEGCWLCAQSGMADHASLPAWSTLAGGSFLTGGAETAGLYAGTPATLRRPL